MNTNLAFSLALLGHLTSAQFMAGQPRTTEVRQAGQLSAGHTIKRDIRPGQQDVYELDATSGQFIRIVANRKGVDLFIDVFDASGEPIVQSDTGNGPDAFVSVCFLSGTGGPYQIKVAAEPEHEKFGEYEILISDLRPPTPVDLKRLQAVKESLAGLNGEKADWRKSVETLQRAAELWHSLGELEEEARCYRRMGERHLRARVDQETAIDYLNRSLGLYRSLNYERVGHIFLSIGAAYSSLWNTQKAVEYYQQSLSVFRKFGDADGKISALSNLGLSYRKLGDKDKGLASYGEAVELARTIRDLDKESLLLNNMGNLYLDLGDFSNALANCLNALKIRQERNNRTGQLFSLISIGEAFENMGDYQKALEYETKALELARTLKHRHLEGYPLHYLGTIYSGMRAFTQANEYFGQALAVWRELGDEYSGEALTLNMLAEMHLNLGRPGDALPHLSKSLRLATGPLLDPGFQGKVLSNIMRYWAAQGNARASIFFGKEAVNQYQRIRGNIRNVDPDLRRSYLKSVSATYRQLAELLIEQGRLGEAEQVLGLLKEQEYFDYIRRAATEIPSRTKEATLTPEEQDLEKRYEEIRDQLMAVGAEHNQLFVKVSRTPEDNQRIIKLEMDLAVGDRKLESFLSTLHGQLDRDIGLNKRIQQVRIEQGLMADLRDLPQGTVLIYTLVAPDKLYMVLRSADAQKQYEYPIKEPELTRKIADFRELLKGPNSDPRPLAEELYRIIVAPLAKDLRAVKARTLMWSLEGVLRYLPVSALYDGKQFLITQYRMSVITATSNARLKQQPNRFWTAARFGVTKRHGDFAALPGVSTELSAISKILQGETILDEQFTESSLRLTLLKGYPVIHIASHFSFQPGDHSKSFLLLGDGRQLRLSELNTLPLSKDLQLLTLSACETGMGDGSEIEGFGEAAQRRGARAVIASLWSVADESTSLFMREFYRIREGSNGITKSEALRQVQRAMLSGKIRPGVPATAKRGLAHSNDLALPDFSHPYYWAPFFLMGNWL